jgi:hypothetical protein
MEAMEDQDMYESWTNLAPNQLADLIQCFDPSLGDVIHKWSQIHPLLREATGRYMTDDDCTHGNTQLKHLTVTLMLPPLCFWRGATLGTHLPAELQAKVEESRRSITFYFDALWEDDKNYAQFNRARTHPPQAAQEILSEWEAVAEEHNDGAWLLQVGATGPPMECKLGGDVYALDYPYSPAILISWREALAEYFWRVRRGLHAWTSKEDGTHG